MRSKILVTGGAGYIGCVLSELLLNYGYNVTVYDNFKYNNETSLYNLCHFEKLKLIKGDVSDYDKLKYYIEKNDIIIPLAALVGAPLCDFNPISATEVNKKSVIKLFELSKKKPIIMPTTNSAYGYGNSNNFCDENTKLNPISKYSVDKVAVEKALIKRGNFISLRLATVFGISPRMRIDLLVNDFVYRACKENIIMLFEGHYKRNYIHVRDVSRAFLFMIKNLKKNYNQIFNVGLSSANISKLELCLRIKKQLPNLEIIHKEFKSDDDKRNYIVSNKKIEKSGFKAIYDLDYGIKELIKGYETIKKYQYGNL